MSVVPAEDERAASFEAAFPARLGLAELAERCAACGGHPVLELSLDDLGLSLRGADGLTNDFGVRVRIPRAACSRFLLPAGRRERWRVPAARLAAALRTLGDGANAVECRYVAPRGDLGGRLRLARAGADAQAAVDI